MFLVILPLLAACASGGGGGDRLPGTGASLADLTNPALGPDYAQWLIGPISFLATAEEVKGYLAVKDDAAAQEFIQQFWARRNPHPGRPDNPVHETFEARGAAADRLYGEAGFTGRQTDRGSIYVVYGPPPKVDFQVPPVPGAPPIEVWDYGTEAAAGLNGRKPSPRYRFSKRGDLTVFYIPGRLDSRLRRPSSPGLP
jgi:GWxTD domain-containing protein